MTKSLRIALFFVLLVLPACSEPEEPASLFSEDQAKETALRFRDLIHAGDAGALRELVSLPFRFRTRQWTKEQELVENLKLQAVVLKSEVDPAAVPEAFSHRELLRGNWPRKERVSDEQAITKISKLGVRPDGYLVRLVGNDRRDLQLVINPSGQTKLLVAAVD